MKNYYIKSLLLSACVGSTLNMTPYATDSRTDVMFGGFLTEKGITIVTAQDDSSTQLITMDNGDAQVSFKLLQTQYTQAVVLASNPSFVFDNISELVQAMAVFSITAIEGELLVRVIGQKNLVRKAVYLKSIMREGAVMDHAMIMSLYYQMPESFLAQCTEGTTHAQIVAAFQEITQ